MGDDAVACRVDVGEVVRICRSTAIAPLTPIVAPAAAASSLSGRTPTTISTMSTDLVRGSPEVFSALTSQPTFGGPFGTVHTMDGGSGCDFDAVPFEFCADERAEFLVDGREYPVAVALSAVTASPGGERFCHLEPDVAGAAR